MIWWFILNIIVQPVWAEPRKENLATIKPKRGLLFVGGTDPN
jgi:hypothetical protein